MRRNRRLRKSLTSHRAPRGWRPAEPVAEIDEATYRIDDLNGPTVRVTAGTAALPTEAVEAPPAGRRGRLVVALVVLAALVTAVALFVTRDRGDAEPGGRPGRRWCSAGRRPASAAAAPRPVGRRRPALADERGADPGRPGRRPERRRATATPSSGPIPSTAPTTAAPTVSVGALATCGGGRPGVAVAFTYEDTWATGFNARVTVDNTGTRRIRSWKVTFDNLTGYVSWLTGGLFHLLGAVFAGNGPLDVGDRGTLEFGVQNATGQPTGCHVTVTY